MPGDSSLLLSDYFLINRSSYFKSLRLIELESLDREKSLSSTEKRREAIPDLSPFSTDRGLANVLIVWVLLRLFPRPSL